MENLLCTTHTPLLNFNKIGSTSPRTRSLRSKIGGKITSLGNLIVSPRSHHNRDSSESSTSRSPLSSRNTRKGESLPDLLSGLQKSLSAPSTPRKRTWDEQIPRSTSEGSAHKLLSAHRRSSAIEIIEDTQALKPLKPILKSQEEQFQTPKLRIDPSKLIASKSLSLTREEACELTLGEARELGYISVLSALKALIAEMSMQRSQHEIELEAQINHIRKNIVNPEEFIETMVQSAGEGSRKINKQFEITLANLKYKYQRIKELITIDFEAPEKECKVSFPAYTSIYPYAQSSKVFAQSHNEFKTQLEQIKKTCFLKSDPPATKLAKRPLGKRVLPCSEEIIFSPEKVDTQRAKEKGYEEAFSYIHQALARAQLYIESLRERIAAIKDPKADLVSQLRTEITNTQNDITRLRENYINIIDSKLIALQSTTSSKGLFKHQETKEINELQKKRAEMVNMLKAEGYFHK